MKPRRPSPPAKRRRPVHTRGRTDRRRPKSNYELFNCNNLNIRYWSWNYRGCWPLVSASHPGWVGHTCDTGRDGAFPPPSRRPLWRHRLSGPPAVRRPLSSGGSSTFLKSLPCGGEGPTPWRALRRPAGGLATGSAALAHMHGREGLPRSRSSRRQPRPTRCVRLLD